MAIIATAKKLWYNGELYTGNCDTSVPCERLSGASPRPAWLVPSGGCCGSQRYGLSLSAPTPLPPGTLTGVWVEFNDGTGMVIDAVSVDAVNLACNACCGTTPVIAPLYNGDIPQPPEPVAATYTISREDNGSTQALTKASLDYWNQYIPNTFVRTNYAAGFSTYTFDAYSDPVLIGNDVLNGETPRVFTSNAAPTLPADNEYTANGTASGVTLPQLEAATVAALLTAIQGNATWAAVGTWTAEGADKVKVSTTTANPVVIVIGVQPIA